MKKVLFFLAAISMMFVANAQVKLIVNGETFEAGATITYLAEEEMISEADYIAMVPIVVENTTDQAMNGVTMEAAIVSAPGYTIESMCSTQCQEGTVTPPFDIPANGKYESVFADFKINPAALAADKKGAFKLTVNTGSGDPIEFNLEITYVPSQAGIADVEMGGVKVWPNPVAHQMMVGCAGASEVVVMDVTGKMMQRIVVNGADEIKVDMSCYNSGIYMCGTIVDGVLKSLSRVVKY